jgi:hypothetical protein
MFGVQGLAAVLLLAAAPVYGQDWRPVQMVPVRYPCLALAVRMQGRVELRFRIDDRGTPQDVTAVRGQPLLLQSAMAHLKSLSIRLEGNKPGSVPRTAIYSFRLDRAEKPKSDLISPHFLPPHTVVVTSGFVKPSSPCEARLE